MEDVNNQQVNKPTGNNVDEDQKKVENMGVWSVLAIITFILSLIFFFCGWIYAFLITFAVLLFACCRLADGILVLGRSLDDDFWWL